MQLDRSAAMSGKRAVDEYQLSETGQWREGARYCTITHRILDFLVAAVAGSKTRHL